MTTIDFIIALFCQVDDHMQGLPKHPQATLWPSEVVTLGILHALKGVGNRAFYRWLARDYRPLFPHLPERTRLFRLFTTHAVFPERHGEASGCVPAHFPPVVFSVLLLRRHQHEKFIPFISAPHPCKSRL
jgi:hypothetical protein